MARLIAIDPGKFAGWCTFEDDTLRACGLVCDHRKKDVGTQLQQFWWLAHEWVPTVAVVETAVIYPPGKALRDREQDPDPNDIVRLAGLANRLGGVCAGASGPTCRLLMVEPRHWKGTTPKEIHNERTQERCPEAVPLLAAIPEGQRNHVWDAIGLGLWYLKR